MVLFSLMEFAGRLDLGIKFLLKLFLKPLFDHGSNLLFFGTTVVYGGSILTTSIGTLIGDRLVKAEEGFQNTLV